MAAAIRLSQQHSCLFDHLVGAGEKRFRNGQSECLCSLEVYDQLEFGGQLNRQVRGIRTLENEIDIRCCAPEQIRRIAAERYQASALREVAIAVNPTETSSNAPDDRAPPASSALCRAHRCGPSC